MKMTVSLKCGTCIYLNKSVFVYGSVEHYSHLLLKQGHVRNVCICVNWAIVGFSLQGLVSAVTPVDLFERVFHVSGMVPSLDSSSL